MLDKGQVLYGLRNLCIGDDEQTRIEDVDDPEMNSIVKHLIAAGEYDLAYRWAIKEAMTGRPDPMTGEIDESTAINLEPHEVLCWALGFESMSSWDDIEAGTIEAIIKLLQLPAEHWILNDGDDGQYAKEEAISLAFEMWALYVELSNE